MVTCDALLPLVEWYWNPSQLKVDDTFLPALSVLLLVVRSVYAIHRYYIGEARDQPVIDLGGPTFQMFEFRCLGAREFADVQ